MEQALLILQNNRILIQTASFQYIDTLDNFKVDYTGTFPIATAIRYNQTLSFYYLDSISSTYPNTDLDAIITNIETIISNKASRVKLENINLDTLKIQKLAEVEKLTEDKITGGFKSSANGSAILYDSDTTTQIIMQGIGINASNIDSLYTSGVPVKGYVDGATEKTIQYLNGTQVLQWLADMSIHIGACKQWGWTKQVAVNACTTVKELYNLNLTD